MINYLKETMGIFAVARLFTDASVKLTVPNSRT